MMRLMRLTFVRVMCHILFMEIEGARSCAVEFRSFSKTAGFTGVRCGYTVVPEEVKAMSGFG